MKLGIFVDKYSVLNYVCMDTEIHNNYHKIIINTALCVYYS